MRYASGSVFCPICSEEVEFSIPVVQAHYRGDSNSPTIYITIKNNAASVAHKCNTKTDFKELLANG